MDTNYRAYSDRINHAFAYAALHPAGHVRKGTRIPYVTHLANVALILARYGRDDDTIVGGILHDVVEDCNDQGHTREFHANQIAEKFGADVLQIVLDVTHDTHDAKGSPLSSEAKKEIYLEHLGKASDRARWVSAADKLHNGRAILSDLARASDPSVVWNRFNVGRDATIHWYRQVYDRLVEVGFRGAILPELLDAVESLERMAPSEVKGDAPGISETLSETIERIAARYPNFSVLDDSTPTPFDGPTIVSAAPSDVSSNNASASQSRQPLGQSSEYEQRESSTPSAEIDPRHNSASTEYMESITNSSLQKLVEEQERNGPISPDDPERDASHS